jgi:hypothetical protein
VDVGCGVGGWLRVAKELGATTVLGMDGEHVPKSQLQIAPEAFRAHDLLQPLPTGPRFNLALCLEVAEHLPASRAESFIKELCQLAPVVLFSAAVPYQGGTQHLNEEWLEYWAALFWANNMVPVDVVRPVIWSNPRVEWWYRQNTIVFCHPRTAFSVFPAGRVVQDRQLTRLHPEFFLAAIRRETGRFRTTAGRDVAHYRALASGRGHPAPGYGPEFDMDAAPSASPNSDHAGAKKPGGGGRKQNRSS